MVRFSLRNRANHISYVQTTSTYIVPKNLMLKVHANWDINEAKKLTTFSLFLYLQVLTQTLSTKHTRLGPLSMDKKFNQLRIYLKNLPATLPTADALGPYARLVNFTPDKNWLKDVGEEGVVNRRDWTCSGSPRWQQHLSNSRTWSFYWSTRQHPGKIFSYLSKLSLTYELVGCGTYFSKKLHAKAVSYQPQDDEWSTF